VLRLLALGHRFLFYFYSYFFFAAGGGVCGGDID